MSKSLFKKAKSLAKFRQPVLDPLYNFSDPMEKADSEHFFNYE